MLHRRRLGGLLWLTLVACLLLAGAAGRAAAQAAVDQGDRASEQTSTYDGVRAHKADDQSGLQRDIQALGSGAGQAPASPTPVATQGATKDVVPPRPKPNSSTTQVVQPPSASARTVAEGSSAPASAEPPVAQTPPSPEDARGRGVTTFSLLVAATIAVLIAAVAIAAFIFRPHSHEEPRENNTPDDPPLQTPDDWFEVDGDDNKHHCQGHRLGVVVGPESDPSIDAARRWLRAKTNVQHKLFIYATISDGRTTEGTLQPDFGAVSSYEDGVEHKLTPGKGMNNKNAGDSRAAIEDYMSRCKCCCHWDEVILVMHGHTDFKWYWLLKNLPLILNGRPVRKFVFWVCGAADDFLPSKHTLVEGKKDDGTSAAPKWLPVFQQVAAILSPKSCHNDALCGCSKDHCTSEDADNHDKRGKCPDGKEAVQLLCASWYTANLDPAGSTHGAVSAKLGMKKNLSALTSPDGSLRDITIHPDGSVTTDILNGSSDVFAGTPLAADGLTPDSISSHVIDTKKAKERTKTEPPPDFNVTVTYSGGTHCAHATKEGCQPDKPAKSKF